MGALNPGDGADVVILGTCLASQELNDRAVATAWGKGEVHGLGMAGTGPMDWALAVRNLLPDGVERIVVAFVPGDLQNAVPPHESRTTELMTVADLPDVWMSCPTGSRTHCGTELALSFAWPAYRYRGFVAAKIWASVGASAPPLPPAGPRAPIAAVPPSPEDALAWIARLTDAAHDHDAAIDFVQMPVRADANRTVASQDPGLPGLKAVLSDHGAGFAQLPSLPAAMFTDEHHVAPEGADQLSAELGAWLRER